MSTAADPAPLRSFKLRRGRITPGQQQALQTLWPRYGIGPVPGPAPDPRLSNARQPTDDEQLIDELIDAGQLFGRGAPLVLEIGFGMGEATVAMASADPARDVLAVDVHTPGAGALLRAVGELGLANVRILVGDAVHVLRDRLAPGSLDEIRLFFPDPWPKTRHHKRRLFSPAFARLAATRLRPGGRLHAATDWTPYAEQMLHVVDDEPLLQNAYLGYAPRPAWRPQTRFERQGLARGHQVHDVIAHRTAAAVRVDSTSVGTKAMGGGSHTVGTLVQHA